MPPIAPPSTLVISVYMGLNAEEYSHSSGVIARQLKLTLQCNLQKVVIVLLHIFPHSAAVLYESIPMVVCGQHTVHHQEVHEMGGRGQADPPLEELQ